MSARCKYAGDRRAGGKGILVTIVETIDRAALVTMEPRTIRTERDQIAEREIGGVPHGAHLNPPAYAGGTDVMKQAPPALSKLKALFDGD